MFAFQCNLMEIDWIYIQSIFFVVQYHCMAIVCTLPESASDENYRV